MKVIANKPIYSANASQFVQLTSSYKENIYVKKGDKTADGKSLLGLIALSIQPGQQVEITSTVDLDPLQKQLMELDLFRP